MAQIEKAQIRDIHVLGAGLGIVERGSHDDGLHQLIAGITGKVSTKELTKAEAEQVLTELMNRMRIANPARKTTATAKSHRYQETPGGMSEGQQRKAWRLMYELQELDTVPSTATLGERLSGIIKKELGVDATQKDPFKWLDYMQGSKLLNVLDKYVKNTAKKRAKG